MELHVQKVEPAVSGQKYVRLLNPDFDDAWASAEQDVACMACFQCHNKCFNVHFDCFCFGL